MDLIFNIYLECKFPVKGEIKKIYKNKGLLIYILQ